MKKPLRVAIYSGEIPSTTFIERLIDGVSNLGHEILLFGAINQNKHYSQNIRVIGYRQRPFLKLWVLLKYTCLLVLFRPSQKRRLDAILKTEDRTDLNTKIKSYPVLWHRPDIFHLQWAKGLKDWIWVRDFEMQLVVSLRGAHINYSPIADLDLAEMYRKNFCKVDGFHAVSDAIAVETTKYGVPLERIRVVKSGLNEKDFHFVVKNAVPIETLKILSVGRNHWIKNYSLALDVMSELKKRKVNFHYQIIGIDDNEALVHQRNQLQLEDYVSFCPQLPFTEVQLAIKDADIVLLPSFKEGIANVVLEAMMLGTLVISTDCGGMAEVVTDAHTGFLVPIRNVGAMADAIESVTKLSLKEYQTMLINARAFVEKHHSNSSMLNEMLGLYHTILSGKS